jgi:hypothetical protein
MGAITNSGNGNNPTNNTVALDVVEEETDPVCGYQIGGAAVPLA